MVSENKWGEGTKRTKPESNTQHCLGEMLAIRIKIQACFYIILGLLAFCFFSYFTCYSDSVFNFIYLDVLNYWWFHVVVVPYTNFLTLPVCLGSVSEYLACWPLPASASFYSFVLPWSSVRTSLLSQAGLSVSDGVLPASSLSNHLTNRFSWSLGYVLYYSSSLPPGSYPPLSVVTAARAALSLAPPARSSWLLNSRSSCASTLVVPSGPASKGYYPCCSVILQ